MALIETKTVIAGLVAIAALGAPPITYVVRTEGRLSTLEADSKSTKELVIETRDLVKELHGHVIEKKH